MTFLINLLEQIVPLISLCFGSARCFSDFIFEHLRGNEIHVTVNSVECEYTRVINMGECACERTYNSSATFYPNPIYSGECRNAVAYQFVPVVILSNAFQAFLLPILY